MTHQSVIILITSNRYQQKVSFHLLIEQLFKSASINSVFTLRPCSRHSVPEVYVVSSVHTPGTKLTNRYVFQSSRNTTPPSSLQVFPGDAYTAPDLLISADSPHVTERTGVNLHQFSTNMDPSAANSVP